MEDTKLIVKELTDNKDVLLSTYRYFEGKLLTAKVSGLTKLEANH